MTNELTINGTTYRVGQVITIDDVRGLPKCTTLEVHPCINPALMVVFKITALPEPQPAEEWREVKLLDYSVEKITAIPLAMQEVCKADEVKLEWPEWTGWTKTDGTLQIVHNSAKPSVIISALDNTIRCFLLGGRVFVKGGE